jgi:competence protein ComGF
MARINHQGFSLLEAVLALGALSLIVVCVASALQPLQQMQHSKTSMQTELHIFKTVQSRALVDGVEWTQSTLFFDEQGNPQSAPSHYQVQFSSLEPAHNKRFKATLVRHDSNEVIAESEIIFP